MILHCNFEELRALVAGAEILAGGVCAAPSASVVAPCEATELVEALLPRLTGDLSIATLADQRRVREAVAAICERLHGRLDTTVLEHNPAHEDAVNFYFDYAHVRTVLDRIDRIGAEMGAMIELITGEPVTAESAESVTFPD
jgi:hypothetical protein